MWRAADVDQVQDANVGYGKRDPLPTPTNRQYTMGRAKRRKRTKAKARRRSSHKHRERPRPLVSRSQPRGIEWAEGPIRDLLRQPAPSEIEGTMTSSMLDDAVSMSAQRLRLRDANRARDKEKATRAMTSLPCTSLSSSQLPPLSFCCSLSR